MFGQVDQLGGLAHAAQGGLANGIPGADDGNDAAVVVGVHLPVEQGDARNREQGIDEGLHLGGVAPFAEVGDTLNQRCRHRDSSVRFFGWGRGHFGFLAVLLEPDADVFFAHTGVPGRRGTRSAERPGGRAGGGGWGSFRATPASGGSRRGRSGLESPAGVMDHLSPLDSQPTKINSEIIRDFRGNRKDSKAHRSACLPASSEPRRSARRRAWSAVDGGGGDGFRRRHPHLRAGQRENHRHGDGGRGAGVEVGGESHGSTSIDESARGRVG